MNKEDNQWEIELPDDEKHCIVHINGEKYYMDDKGAGLCHAILLLVDAINDKNS